MRKAVRNKSGLSPVIATVMLIGIVVVSGLIVFTWFKGFTQEAIQKSGQNAQLVCGDVKFQAGLSGTTLSVSNVGNIPIYGMLVKIESASGFEPTRDLKEDIISPRWPDNGLNFGGTFSGNLQSNKINGKDSITLIPILRGSTQKGTENSYVCDENQYGYTISL